MGTRRLFCSGVEPYPLHSGGVGRGPQCQGATSRISGSNNLFGSSSLRPARPDAEVRQECTNTGPSCVGPTAIPRLEFLSPSKEKKQGRAGNWSATVRPAWQWRRATSGLTETPYSRSECVDRAGMSSKPGLEPRPRSVLRQRPLSPGFRAQRNTGGGPPRSSPCDP